MEGNVCYLIGSLGKKRKEQQEKANMGGPNEIGATDWEESLQVAAYATFYTAEDLLKSSENLKKLTYALIVLTALLAVLTLISVL
jgi:hypothetical protein